MILSPKHLPRLISTVRLFTNYGLRDFANRQGLLNLEGTALDEEAALEGDAKAKAKAFRERLVELGPAYIKLGQILSTRPDLLPRRTALDPRWAALKGIQLIPKDTKEK